MVYSGCSTVAGNLRLPQSMEVLQGSGDLLCIGECFNPVMSFLVRSSTEEIVLAV